MSNIKSYKEEFEYSGLTLPFNITYKSNQANGILVDHHWHEWYQVIFMIEGDARLSIEECTQTVVKDDVVILNQGTVHSFSTLGNPSATYMVVMFHPDMIRSMGMSLFESKYIMAFLNDLSSKSYSLRNDLKTHGKLLNILNGMLEEYQEQDSGYELVIKGYIYQLLALLMRCGFFSEGYHNDAELQKLDKLFRYIEAHFREKIDMKQAADYLNLSYSYFSKYFKLTTGKTFKGYLDFVRISEAERLLMNEGYNVTEAAYEVGFSDVSSFNRVFKRVKQYSPKEVKKIKSVK